MGNVGWIMGISVLGFEVSPPIYECLAIYLGLKSLPPTYGCLVVFLGFEVSPLTCKCSVVFMGFEGFPPICGCLGVFGFWYFIPYVISSGGSRGLLSSKYLGTNVLEL